MNSKINLSTFSSIFTILTTGGLLTGCIVTYGSDTFLLMLAMSTMLLVAAMLFAPLSIRANNKEVEIHSLFKKHSIPIRRIESCEHFQPTLGSIRVCGSGGFMGYWGIFREGDVGRYMAYYGKASDCFIIHLDNGDKYVLGCKNSGEMIKYINAQLQQ